MLVTIVGSSVGAVAGGAAGTATAWRAAGLPSVATEAFVKSFVGQKIEPLNKAVIALDSRTSDLFDLQKSVLAKVSDHSMDTLMVSQLAALTALQKRIEARLTAMEKPQKPQQHKAFY